MKNLTVKELNKEAKKLLLSDQEITDFITTETDKRTLKRLLNSVIFTKKKGGYDLNSNIYCFVGALAKKGLIFEAIDLIYAIGYKKGYTKANRKEISSK